MIDEKISNLISRPAEKGHIGEFIAANIFDIELNASASQKGNDGIFNSGILKGRTVNVKFSSKQNGFVNLQPDHTPDYYLVLIGPKSNTSSSRNRTRPWIITSVFLFDAQKLHNILKSRGVKIGIASSVHQNLWNEYEIYPTLTNRFVNLTKEQQKLLQLFK